MMTLGLFTSIGDIVNNVADFIVNITKLVTEFFNFIRDILNFIPQPFRNIFIVFSLTIAVVIIVKFVGAVL